MAVPGKTHSEGTTKSTAPPVGPAQAIKAHRCKEEQGAAKLALSSQGQHKVTAKGEAPEPGRTHGVEAQRCKEERGAAKPALASQFLGKYTAKASAPEAGRAQAVESESLRGGGRAGEKIFCDGRVLEANKELSGPHGAQPPMIIPTIVIESPSSSEHSLPEEPIYDTSLLMPPPRIHKRRRSRERAQKRCVIPIHSIPGCRLPVEKQRWRNSGDSPKTPWL